MQGLFIHDHRFPINNKKYYYSYGFDEEFFNRYLSIFDKFSIIGREKYIDKVDIENFKDINSEISFFTVNNLLDIKDKNIRRIILDRIIESDYLIVRLPSILGLYAIKIAEKYNKPYIIEIVGCPWDAISNKGIMSIFPAILITIMTRKVIYSSKYCVYVTEEFLEKRYPTKGKYIACSNVTLNSVDKIDLQKRIEKLKNIDIKNKVIIGTCATIDVVYKGQEDVIKAISILKNEGYDVEYQLVGGGSKVYLESIAKKYGVLEEVKFIGALKHKDVFSWLETIDIYVHPSKQEGLSRAIIEAMSKGCPIFAANAGGIHELIDDKYIFKKGNIKEICEIYKSFNKESLIEQAKKNYNNSKKYLKLKLYRRREEFFKEFIQNYME